MGDYAGKLIVFEGLDGSGKSTLIKRCAQRFAREFQDAHHVGKFPTERHVGALLREDFLSQRLTDQFTEYGMSTAEILQQLMFLDRATEAKIKGGLWDRLHKGEILFYDRYIGSREAYQGAVASQKKGSTAKDIRACLDQIALEERNGIVMPLENLVVYVQLPVEGCLAILQQRNGKPEIYERVEFLQAVHEMYEELSLRRRWETLTQMDQRGKRLTIEEVEEKLFEEILYPFFEKEEIERNIAEERSQSPTQ